MFSFNKFFLTLEISHTSWYHKFAQHHERCHWQIWVQYSPNASVVNQPIFRKIVEVENASIDATSWYIISVKWSKTPIWENCTISSWYGFVCHQHGYKEKLYLKIETFENFVMWPYLSVLLSTLIPILTSNLAIHKVKESY
jgi:hypothetical protein